MTGTAVSWQKVELRPCDAEADGVFIRELTRANFFEIMDRTVGWDEERHMREPSQPESYTMVVSEGAPIGFISVRAEPDRLYLKTVQLIPEARGTGVGTWLMGHVEAMAGAAGKDRIGLRVFKENPAQSLYARLGYRVIESDAHSHLMEKHLDVAADPSHPSPGDEST